MKSEMQMLPNGNYESVICPIQHKCEKDCYTWTCTEYSYKPKKLFLKFSSGDPHEDGIESEIEVGFCPFCGYSPEKTHNNIVLL